eukprot:scaffold3091_cov103-Skeletonema_marinoi.AAC.4
MRLRFRNNTLRFIIRHSGILILPFSIEKVHSAAAYIGLALAGTGYPRATGMAGAAGRYKCV